ncbi:MAG: hypothetical protein JO265_03170 [Acidimicrobiia bacterium]|nr:hypothetical protein [Acidimicrobiia bacterium]
MAEELTQETFESLVGSRFGVLAPGGASVGAGQEVELVEVRSFGAAPAQPAPTATGFALLFVGPAGAQLPQGTYELAHPELGTVPLFLVPVGLDERGVQYEAVFTRLS